MTGLFAKDLEPQSSTTPKAPEADEHGFDRSQAAEAAPERLLSALEQAAGSQDSEKLTQLLRSVDWRNHDPGSLSRAVDLCLSLDMILLARKLASEGTQLFPGDDRLRRAAVVLAPPRVIGTRPAPPNRAANISADQEWFKKNASLYKGKWVAVTEGKLLGAATTLEALTHKIGDEHNNSETVVVKVLS